MNYYTNTIDYQKCPKNKQKKFNLEGRKGTRLFKQGASNSAIPDNII